MSDPTLQPRDSSSSVSDLPPSTPMYSTSAYPSPSPDPGFSTVQTDLPPPYPGPNPGPYPGPYPTLQPGEGPYPILQPLEGPYPALKPGEAPYPALQPGEAPYPALKSEEGSMSYQTFPESGPIEEAGIASSAFDDQTVKRAFLRKVFSLVFLQLLFTFSVVCVFTFSSVVKEAVQSSIWPYVSSFIVFLVVVVPLSFCNSLSRRHPWNLIALGVVTVTLSYMVGTVASYHDTVIVVLTMGATLAIALAIIAYSIQTRWDFSICYGLLLILSVDLIMFGVFSTFYYSHMAQVAYGTLGALLFSLFLIIDVQWTMSTRVSPDEYVSAALLIYLDVVLIFLYLLGRR